MLQLLHSFPEYFLFSFFSMLAYPKKRSLIPVYPQVISSAFVSNPLKVVQEGCQEVHELRSFEVGDLIVFFVAILAVQLIEFILIDLLYSEAGGWWLLKHSV